MRRQIFSNTAAQLVAKAVAVLLTFVTTVLILRIGGPSLFGDLTKALSLIAIGYTTIDFGLNAESVRSMQGGIKSRSQILFDTILLRFFLSITAILALNILVFALPGGYTPAIKSVFWIGSLSILFQGVYTSLNAWYQRHLSYWKSSLAVILGTAVGTLLTYYFVVHSPTLGNLLLASTLGYFVIGVASILQVKIKPSDFDFRRTLHRLLPLLRRALPLGLILLANIISSKVDTVVLGVFRPSEEVGQYGFAYRIFDVALVIPVFVMNSVYPLLLDLDTRHKSKLVAISSHYLLVLGILGSLVLFSLAPLINLVRPEMELSITSLRLLSLSLPFFYLSAPLMWQLIEARLEKSLLILYALAALGNALCNLLFAPTYGPAASAILTGITEAFILLGLYHIRLRFLRVV